jgi:hypothetical protein
VNYTEFLAVKKSLGIDEDTAGGLMMCGPRGDNQTGYALVSKKGIDIGNTYRDIFQNGNYTGKDFVWLTHGSIRTFGLMESGGHPALTRGSLPLCAGRIEAGFFFYHSGHYKPEKLEAICHFVDFVEHSVVGLSGIPRDNEVARLCAMTLRLYRGRKSEDIYDARFEEPSFHGSLAATGREGTPYRGGVTFAEARRASIEVDDFSSHDHDSAGEHDLFFAFDDPSPPRSASPLLTRVSVESASSLSLLPPTPHIQPSPKFSTTISKTTSISTSSSLKPLSIAPLKPQAVVHSRPVWEPDNASSRCRLCRQDFSFINRRHHCRKCGRLVCKTCSTIRKLVKDPAKKTSTAPEVSTSGSAVRVCDDCAQL